MLDITMISSTLFTLTICNLFFLTILIIQSAKLRKLPPFMTMSLLRFSFDFAKCERYKETGRYSFPLTINLRPFCEQVLGKFKI